MKKLPSYQPPPEDCYNDNLAQTNGGSSNADTAAGFDMDDYLEAHIEQQLAAVYRSLKSEPIPDRLLDILKQIKPGGSEE